MENQSMNQLAQSLNEKIYSQGKFGICQSAEGLHEFLTGIVKEMAETENPIERKALLHNFQMHMPNALHLEHGLG